MAGMFLVHGVCSLNPRCELNVLNVVQNIHDKTCPQIVFSSRLDYFGFLGMHFSFPLLFPLVFSILFCRKFEQMEC